MRETLTLCIAGLTISIEGNLAAKEVETPLPYRHFLTSGTPDLRLRLHEALPEIWGEEQVFECPPVWSLSRRNGTSFIRIFGDMLGLERILVVPEHFRDADLFLPRPSGRVLDPFYGPTVELLMLTYLAQGRGAILHACAAARDGRGLLFVGESGAGKSTLARIWNKEKGITVLSDDRVVVRKEWNEFRIYGTPWHGQAKFASPLEARLERVFFLKHGEKNTAREKNGIASVSHLLTCAFLPHWDSRGMAFSLDFLSELAASVPCEELTFTPDRRAIELVEKVVG